MTTTTLRRAAVRTGRLLAAPVAVFVLALGLVVSGPGREAAQADVLPLLPVAVAETGAAPVESGGAIACAASVICLGVVTGVVLIGALYLTRDHWVPYLNNGIKNGLSLLGINAGGGGSASMTAGVTQWTGLPTAIRLDLTWASCGNQNCSPFGANPSRYWQCKSTDTGVITAGSSSNSAGSWQANGTGSAITLALVGNAGTGWYTQTVCGAGQELIFYRLTPSAAGSSASPLAGQNIVWGKAVPNAQVSQTSTVHCHKPDGTTGTISRNQVGFPDQIIVPSCITEFGLGSYPLDFAATAGWPGFEQPAVTMSPRPTSPATQYPDCFGSAGEYLNTCRVRIWINGAPCAIGVAICANWDSYEQDHPGSQVQCQWGNYVVSMDNCELLKDSYKPDAKTQVITQTDPKTGQPTATLPPLVDPWTGVCLLNCTPPPVPPDCVGSTCTPSGPDETNCMAGAVSWNPINWVYVPVKCALKWAFVPTSAQLTDFTSAVTTAWNNSTPGTWASAVGAALPSSSEAGCAGPTFALPGKFLGMGAVSFDPLNSCTQPGSTLAPIVKALNTAFIVWIAGFTAVRILGMGFGWSPGLGRADT